MNIQRKQFVCVILHFRFAGVPNGLTKFGVTKQYAADPSGRAVKGVGLWPLACWDCGFESRREHVCPTVKSVVCCQVEVSATSWSLFQRNPTDSDASCVIKKPREWRGPGPLGAVAPKTNKATCYKSINRSLDTWSQNIPHYTPARLLSIYTCNRSYHTIINYLFISKSITRETMSVRRNIEACSWNSCCSGKAISITKHVCVCVCVCVWCVYL